MADQARQTVADQARQTVADQARQTVAGLARQTAAVRLSAAWSAAVAEGADLS